MPDASPALVQNIHLLEADVYQHVIQHYLEQISDNPYVRAVYQIGSVGHPGISDLDLIVVVDPVRDPSRLNGLSIHGRPQHDVVRYVFPHDVYVYDADAFRDIHYSLYADNLQLIYGRDQEVAPCPEAARRWLSLQILFDFTAPRLAQFQNLYAAGQLDARGILLRTASFKHSYRLLQTLGIDRPEHRAFVEQIMALRDRAPSVKADALMDLFTASFRHFSEAVTAAADYFAQHVLRFHSDVDASSALKLNPVQLLRFSDDATDLNRPGRDRFTVYYPGAAFFHFLTLTRQPNFIGERARSHLTYSGDEVFALDPGYEETLQRRAAALSDHFAFLNDNGLLFAMKGNPGFVTAWNGVPTWAERLAFPAGKVPLLEKTRHNILLDRATQALPLEAIRERLDVPVAKQHFPLNAYDEWVERFLPDWGQRYQDKRYKKPIELFFTYKLLDPQPEDAFMDAAGGINTYLHRIDVAARYMQNIVLGDDLRRLFGAGLTYLEGDAGAIPVPDASIDKISMHHSFEHFQGPSDVDFIREAQRMLRPGGRCCILPLFLGTSYVEVTRIRKAACPFDPTADYLVDPTARLTGGPSCGDFARVYDLDAFRRRILDAVDRDRFEVSILELYLDDRTVPFEDLACHRSITAINFPYRALMLERKA